MPRPRASSEQQLKAYKLYIGGVGPTAIWEALIEKFDDAVSQRTVSTWVRGFRDGTKAREEQGLTDLDVPFEWHRLEEYGLPWEASGYLIEMWAWYKEFWTSVATTLNRPEPPPPTVRQARWWWRVHLAVPEMEVQMNVYCWAEAFGRRELLHGVLGLPLYVNDLERLS